METLVNQPLRKLNTFICEPNLRCGDFILFQEYSQGQYDGTQHSYEVSKPAFAIFVGLRVCDQTLEFGYVMVQNAQRSFEIPEVDYHIEWNDYADILGHWSSRPSWKEILAAYRKQAPAGEVLADQIDWSMYKD
jgi:hypothetical protein